MQKNRVLICLLKCCCLLSKLLKILKDIIQLNELKSCINRLISHLYHEFRYEVYCRTHHLSKKERQLLWIDLKSSEILLDLGLNNQKSLKILYCFPLMFKYYALIFVIDCIFELILKSLIHFLILKAQSDKFKANLFSIQILKSLYTF